MKGKEAELEEGSRLVEEELGDVDEVEDEDEGGLNIDWYLNL